MHDYMCKYTANNTAVHALDDRNVYVSTRNWLTIVPALFLRVDTAVYAMQLYLNQSGFLETATLWPTVHQANLDVRIY